MKIGILISSLSPDIGGGFTFENNIYNALINIDSFEHSFYFFHYGKIKKKERDIFTYIELQENESDINSHSSVNGKEKLLHPEVLRSKNEKHDKIVWLKRKIFKLLYGSSLDNFIKEQTQARIETRNFIKKLTAMSNYDNFLNKAVCEHQIELMWFLGPSYFQPVHVPYIYTLWDLAHRIYPYFPEVSYEGWNWDNREELYNVTLHKSVYIFTGTEAGKKELLQLYNIPEGKIKVIPFPSPSLNNKIQCGDIDSILERENISNPYLLYPAQFWPHKNHIALLRAAAILKDTYDLHFNIVFTGSDKGNRRYIEDKVEELRLADNVFFLGFVPVNDLICLYQNAFALVFPTFFGPDNIPPLEAFALSCPVIASRVSGAQEQLGDAAILFDPENEEEIARSVKKLVDEPDLRQSLIKKGLERSKQWRSEHYVEAAISTFDKFKAIRRCWG
jgi:glycosyltransferase involved in cell wall biosynthesis